MTASTPNNGLLIIERILRDRAGIWRQIVAERELRPLTLQMLASSLVSLALYGAVLGASFGWNQALSSFIKLPLLFLATLAICLPTLYLFNLVFGARLSMAQAVSLIMVSITVTAVLTLAFAPISLFFLITAQSYSFFKLLNVAILILTAAVGLRFLIDGMRALNDQAAADIALANMQQAGLQPAQPAPAAVAAADQLPVQPVQPVQPARQPVPALAALNSALSGGVPVPSASGAPVPVSPAPMQGAELLTAPAAPGPMLAGPMLGAPQPGQPFPVYAMQGGAQPMHGAPRATAPTGERSTSMTLLYIWMLLFGFVGTQLAWTLRPFFGSPGEPFGLFRHIGGTFYGDILHTLGILLGGG